MPNKPNNHPFNLEFDHIDPEYPPYSWRKGCKNYQLVCGWKCLQNLCELTASENTKKCDAFVPYRINKYEAPKKPGDFCEFLVDGDWVLCEFMGSEWWFQASEIGYGKIINGRKNSRTAKAREATRKRCKGSRMANDGTRNVRLHPGEPLPEGSFYGMLKSETRNHGSFSWCNNGKEDKRYNPKFGIPLGYIPGRINGPGFAILNSETPELKSQRARKNGSKAKTIRDEKSGRFKKS